MIKYSSRKLLAIFIFVSVSLLNVNPVRAVIINNTSQSTKSNEDFKYAPDRIILKLKDNKRPEDVAGLITLKTRLNQILRLNSHSNITVRNTESGF